MEIVNVDSVDNGPVSEAIDQWKLPWVAKLVVGPAVSVSVLKFGSPMSIRDRECVECNATEYTVAWLNQVGARLDAERSCSGVRAVGP